MRDSGVIRNGDYWVSKIDQSFICQVGDDKFFTDNGISHFIQNHAGYKSRADIGYNPLSERWFTWSFDYSDVRSFGIDELQDSDVHPTDRKCLGFRGAKAKVIQIAASHTCVRSSHV